MNWVAKVSSLRNIVYLSASCLALASCQTVYGAGEYIGRYMPVVGERCEHWQCITSEGQAQSEAKKMRLAEDPTMVENEDELDKPDTPPSSEKRPNTFTEERPPIIPPSTESGLPEVEQRGARKPFPKQY